MTSYVTPLGITLGRTQLFALSPKKTVEGFVGALFSTLIFGFFVSIRVDLPSPSCLSRNDKVGLVLDAVRLHDLSSQGSECERVAPSHVQAERCLRVETL